MKLRPKYPASFPVLLLAGFFLVSLPLLGGMVNASYMVARIADEGHQAIDVTLAVTRAGRQLVEGVSSLQRAAGQYYVLESPSLGQAFQEAHDAIQANFATLLRQPLDARQNRQVVELARAEAELFERLGRGRAAGAGQFDTYSEAFDRLYGAAVEVEAEGQRLIDRQVAAMGESADAVRHALVWQALAMIPLSLFLTGLFSWLINRPLRQLARVIRRLGEDDLGEFPPVEGPRDLAYLGGRLDWLRLRLLDLEQQQANFLRHVSHELKTPLAALREGVELLADGVVGQLAPQQREVTSIMRGNVRELQRRIEGLIQYSRIRQGGEPLDAQDLDLDDILAVAARRHDLSLGRKEIRLSMALDGARVRADRGKLESVFENLLGNAIRFSPRGGRIEVAAARDRGQVVVTVCDQGPGVAREDRAHIFRPFYQGSAQPPGALRGSGLGLAIVREYVEQHGGQVCLLEPRPNGATSGTAGACFQVRLPTPEADHAN
jgi:two-component system, NtrC family, sensor histidine kinase GlrK